MVLFIERVDLSQGGVAETPTAAFGGGAIVLDFIPFVLEIKMVLGKEGLLNENYIN